MRLIRVNSSYAFIYYVHYVSSRSPPLVLGGGSRGQSGHEVLVYIKPASAMGPELSCITRIARHIQLFDLYTIILSRANKADKNIKTARSIGPYERNELGELKTTLDTSSNRL